MNFDERLEQIAERYRSQGYRVVARPGPADLPAFARDFKVEILAERADGHVLASVKPEASHLQNDPETSRYAGVIDSQPGWRYDLHVLGPEPRPTPEPGDAKEPTDDDLDRTLQDTERMIHAGFTREALIAAWAALEAAMRSRLRAEGNDAGWGTAARTLLNDLYSDGLLPAHVFRELESLFRARNALVHGFTIPTVEERDVRFLIEAARKLLDETRKAKKSA